MVSGKVTRGGAPMEGAYVRLLDGEGEYVSERRTPEDGAFRFNIPRGRWSIVVFGPGIERVSRQVTGEEEEMVVEVGG